MSWTRGDAELCVSHIWSESEEKVGEGFRGEAWPSSSDPGGRYILELVARFEPKRW